MSGETVRYLTRNDLLAVIEAALPESTRIRDAGQLQSAMVRPQTTAFGEDAYPDLWEKAAALMQSLLIGHPLNDGDKRVGMGRGQGLPPPQRHESGGRADRHLL